MLKKSPPHHWGRFIISIQVCSPVKSEESMLFDTDVLETFPFKCVHPLRVSSSDSLSAFLVSLLVSIQVCSPVKSEAL